MPIWRRTKQPDPEHPEPVEIELGVLPRWQADVVLADLGERYRMKAIDQSSIRNQGGTDVYYKVLVHADDADAVRRELVAAELLEG